jgi:GH35 family endo-1,4-beta-xylanase
MNRRTFLKTAAASAIGLGYSTRSAENDRPRADDEAILSLCRARIAEHRQSDAVLVLRDGAGRPIPRATVKIEQTRHDFLFGCNFFMFGRMGEPALEEAYRARFTALLNYCTLGFYWANYESERGKPNYDYTDRALEFCAHHGLRAKGHPLVWDHRAGSPVWLPDDLKEIERLSNARVREIVARFRGRMDMWDVVNEATHLAEHVNMTRMADWGQKLGAHDYTAAPLAIARAANPHATLLVNDYRLEPAYFKILDGLRVSGRLQFDVVGLQSHMHDGGWPLRKVWDMCDRYAPLGVPLHFTETTLVSGPRLGPGENWGATTPEGEAKQAEDTVKFYRALFAHPAVEAITWWDFSDRGAWQRAAAGWLRKDQSPKPVYDCMLALIKGEWWTKAERQPNAQGQVLLRAFRGQYRVIVTLPSGFESKKEIHVQRGKPNQFELTIA